MPICLSKTNPASDHTDNELDRVLSHDHDEGLKLGGETLFEQWPTKTGGDIGSGGSIEGGQRLLLECYMSVVIEKIVRMPSTGTCIVVSRTRNFERSSHTSLPSSTATASNSLTICVSNARFGLKDMFDAVFDESG